MQTDSSTTTVVDESAAPQPPSDPKAAWHAPTITRIDIKRTMNGSGPFPDGSEIPSLG